MLNEALLIVRSVGFLEKQIQIKTSELEEAYNNDYFNDIELLEKQVRALIHKVGEENKNMDIFMLKYEKEIKNEKEAILSCVEQKE